MIPSLRNVNRRDPLYSAYVEALKNSAFTGDIEDAYASRLLVATDNSVYQALPQAVIFPKNEADMVIAVRLWHEERFKKLIFTPRGGGTGTNGQSLNHGLVMDTSRYMKGVGEIHKEAREVTVQAGVIKDELNEKLLPLGLFFSPELSTSSRATIGGMVSNDAAGQGSLKYGRTSSHVKGLRLVLRDGTVADLHSVSGDELEEKLKLDNLEGELYRALVPLLKSNKDKVREIFPKLNRFMTGYDLDHAYDARTESFNLHRLVCGAEGTLGFISEVTLDLTPLPTYRALLTVKYRDFDAALRQAQLLIEAGALSVETVDSRVLGLAKLDPVWVKASPYIEEVPGAEINGVNIVEFAGSDPAAEKEKLLKLYARVEELARVGLNGVIGAQMTESKEGINAVYAMRKKAVGLLGAAHGRRKLVAFTEDTVVPPEHLADYIQEFRALLDSMEVPYGMFGHVDTGLMHVRPGLDLTTDEDRRKLKAISEGVVQLVSKYGGQMWGEHGRGYRSVFGPVFFKELYPVAREVKTLFDPDNRINPGKICVPTGSADELVAIDGPMRGDLDRTLPLAVQESFEGALACNGNGQCFSYSRTSLMCPSYRYTGDHVRSPKGYSALMREWLRLMVERGYDPLPCEVEALSGSRYNPVKLLKRAYYTLTDKEDFNHDYLKNIATCLACKSCKTQCPTHVNAADLNSRYLSLYYERYLRPSMDLATLNAEWLIPLLAKMPRLANALLQQPLVKKANARLLKLVDLPLFATTPLKDAAKAEGIPYLSVKRMTRADVDTVIVVDPFTAAYDVKGLMALAKLARLLGKKPGFLRPYVNGKLLTIRGDRRSFIRFASRQAARLDLLSHQNLTLVGYDPALTICYRDEYVTLLKERRGTFEVLLPEEWLEKLLEEEPVKAQLSSPGKGGKSSGSLAGPYYLFCHCTENALLPRATLMWQHILSAFGLTLLPVPVACCGMAGLFGHMAANQDETRQVYLKNWAPDLRSRPFERCLVTGFSCRSQVRRMEGRAALHPVEVLLKALKEGD